MDLDKFRLILMNTRANVWEIIDAAISVASLDYGNELKDRRDLIIERLYAATTRCENCDVDRHVKVAAAAVKKDKEASIEKENGENQKLGSPFSTPHTVYGDDEEEGGEEEFQEQVGDPYGGLFGDDEEIKILRIKEQI